MSMNRRQVLKAGGALAAATALPDMASAQATFAPAPGAWRNFQTVTRLEIAKHVGQVQAWIPLPAFSAEDWFKPAGSTWTTNATTAEIKRDAKYNAEMLHVVWGADEKAPVVEVTSKFATRDRAVDLSKPGNVAALSAADHKLYTSATELIPVDGIVKETSDKITAGATSDLDKARRIYEWIVDNTHRDPKTRGCGVGDIASMLRSGNLGGKCADLNTLFVGLARAAGVPARDNYGIRIDESAAHKTLGKSGDITTAQHCRPEFYLVGLGWVPVDPSDVRQLALDEDLPLAHPRVAALREKLFGSWEMNWVAFNQARDVILARDSVLGELPFFMYPQAEVAGHPQDSLEPEEFAYKIVSAQLVGTGIKF